MQFLQTLGFATPAMAVETALALAARIFVFNLATACTFLGSLRIAHAVRAQPRGYGILALIATGVGALLFLLDHDLLKVPAGVLYAVCFLVGLRRLRGLLAERAGRWGLRAPALGHAAFGAGLLVAFDGLFLAQSVTTILVAPIAAIVQLVRAAADALGGRSRSALERLAGAVVWAGAGAAILSFIMYNHTLARTRAKNVIAACRRYEADNGRLPSSLGELVPRYLAAVPRAKSTPFNYAFEYSDHRSPAPSDEAAQTPELRAGSPPLPNEEDRGVAPAKAGRDAGVLARSRAQGLKYDGKGPIHSLRYSTDGPFARWVYFFEQDEWVLLK
jgi:hypothetical protein